MKKILIFLGFIIFPYLTLFILIFGVFFGWNVKLLTIISIIVLTVGLTIFIVGCCIKDNNEEGEK